MTPFLERYSQGCGQPGRDWFHPLSGWFLVEAMRLEDIRPGFLAYATRASPTWRNAVAAALSSGVRHSPESFLLRADGEASEGNTDAQVADALVAMKPMCILEATYPEVPPSLPAILRKIGSGLLSTAEGYARLYALLTSHEPEHQARRRVLEKIDARLDDELIQVVEILDLSILSPKTAMAVRTASEAHKINARLPVIRQVCSTATSDALRQSIEDAPHFRASNWVRGWLGRADRLPALGIPLDNDPGVVRIVPATARTMGREWQNCLAGHTNAMALGSTAYFAIPDLNVIALLTGTDGGWLLSGLHGRANFPVSAMTAQRVKERLRGQGVICLMPSKNPDLAMIEGLFHSVDDLEFQFEGMTPHQ
ncbi:hypothetical protein [uncultured Brevundimonas sp.]|uniref:hypothetical protein n=1 Tax=uncultured Brevundimonas sp. TaxID=213418 RepID=UPI002616E28E|nr:hypothetical protein [uncultured Brevundimonas sp.]